MRLLSIKPKSPTHKNMANLCFAWSFTLKSYARLSKKLVVTPTKMEYPSLLAIIIYTSFVIFLYISFIIFFAAQER